MIYSGALLALGVLFLIGLLADQIGRRSKIPRVTLLLICGVAAGYSGLLPEQVAVLTDTITVTALTFVSFLLGGSLKRDSLRAHGVQILVISLAIVGATLLCVTLGLYVMGTELALALVLASIATATAPAATLDVVRQSGVSNSFTRVVTGIVAIDDAWGLIVFSICLSLAAQMVGSTEGIIFSSLYEIGGAVLLGLVIGLPAAFLTGHIAQGEPLQIEALAIAFLTAGLAVWLEVSFLIAGMVVGALIVNVAPHHKRAFHEIEHIQWPFMVVFFILAGASLEVSTLRDLGLFGAAFVGLRVLARLVGGWIGAGLSGVPKPARHLYGIALMPQAGVAIGMALLAGQLLPDWKEQIMGLTISATVLFELFGPLCTNWAIKQSVEISSERPLRRSDKQPHKAPP